MKCADRKYLLKEAQRTLDESDSTAAFCLCQRWILKDALAMLKEQEPLAVYEDKVNKCVCGNEINRYWHPEYCGFCGRNLLWY